MKVALSWWQPSAGGSRQAIRGNCRALRAVADEVDLYWLEELGSADLDQYDVTVVPYIQLTGQVAPDAFADTHLHLQLGGYAPDPDPRAIQATVRAADTISALDPSIVRAYGDAVDFPTDAIGVVPNPPNWALFETHPIDAAEGWVLAPQASKAVADAPGVDALAERTPGIRYETHGTGVTGAPDNVVVRPPVPLTAMPGRYRQASVVAVPGPYDVLPNTAFEAFLSGRPYVCDERALGRVQSLPADVLDPEAFGTSVASFDDRFGDDYGAGEHYVGCDGPRTIATEAKRLATGDRDAAPLVSKSVEWLAAWGGWDWPAKGRALRAMIDAGGPLATPAVPAD